MIVKAGRIINIGKRDEVQIPEQATIYEISGKTLIPGMINAHLHLTQSGVEDFMKPFAESMLTKLKRNAGITLRSGVTTVRNMPGGGGNTIYKFKEMVEQGKVSGPRIFTSGPALSAPFGYFSLRMFIPLNKLLRSIVSHIFGANGLSIDVNSDDEVKNGIKKLKENRVDFIKTVSPGGYPFVDRDEHMRKEIEKMGMKKEIMEACMKPEILESIVEKAHKEGLKVSVHNVCYENGFKAAVMAGADSIEHTPLGILDDETLDYMKEKDITWVPTAYTFLHWANLMDHPEVYETKEMIELIPEPFHSLGRKALDQAREGIKQGTNPIWKKFYDEITTRYVEEYLPKNLQNAMDRGIRIVAGDDGGAPGAGYIPHGQLYKELETLVQYGMSEFEAIQAATIHAAVLLGMDKELGSIEVGKLGDLVVLDGNPLEKISNLGKVNKVIQEGVIVYQR